MAKIVSINIHQGVAASRSALGKLMAVCDTLDGHLLRLHTLEGVESIPNLDADKSYCRPMPLPAVSG